ncbi:MAG TPA: pyridoxamine 5'-phosphate oxidase family protein [Patescibacteria group bacterium]|nr:pyridoxamine 5'-phosphate oxidase family protein [Patescibacteria group bacterium]
MGVRKLIEDYLQEAMLMQIATAKNNQPWVCTVHFASDNALHLFWISQPDRRHSKEIEENALVAGTIVIPHTKDQKARGLQFQGIAKKLTDKKEFSHAIEVLAKRMEYQSEKIHNLLEGKDNHVPYQIIPEYFVLFDVVNFPQNPQQTYVVKKGSEVKQ